MARILATVPPLGTDMFYLVDHDNVQQIRTLISSVPMVLEVETFTNLTPIMYAMLKNKKTMVNIMAGRSPSRFRDSILLGIYMGDVSAVSSIIRSGDFEKTHEIALFYGNYLTPLMYACNCSHYGMVRTLIQLNEKLPVPHRPECACKLCAGHVLNGDALHWILTRLNSYEAVCSHAYLLQDHILDPVRRAFQLGRRLELCKANDPINTDAYERIARHAGRLSIALLNCCETDEEVTLMFKQTDGQTSDAYVELPLIRLAVDAKQKEFLSDPICLKMLKKHWMGGWSDWYNIDRGTKAYRILYHTLLYPFTSVLYVLSNGDLACSFDYPIARFVSFVTSYIVFLLCLLIFTQHQEVRNLRGPPDTTFKIILLYYIWSYIGGMTAVMWTDMNRRRWRSLFGAWWRWFDFVQMLAYGLAYCASYLSETLIDLHEEPYSHRVHWDSRHPTLVFEVLFTCAAIMSSWRVFYFLQLQRTLGPLVISVGHCARDVVNFLALFLIIVFSFALGMCYIMEHYAEDEPSYLRFWRGSMLQAIKYLYWAWYGYLDPERLEEILGKHNENTHAKIHLSLHTLGEVFCALYYIVLVVSLLNVMISMMASSAGTILKRRHSEWNYVRCQIWCEFFEDIRAVPPPICLLQLIVNMPTWFCRRICGSYGKLSMWALRVIERSLQLALSMHFAYMNGKQTSLNGL